ncbi:hypothetical protein OG21DRAFT_1102294 [Imleria badia]|nr:hypothetical protein OG21DRAFT_1102294 [Imleria badia]
MSSGVLTEAPRHPRQGRLDPKAGGREDAAGPQSLGSMGNAALNFSMVARALDLYWPWDVCAGMVIAEEAGGVVTGSHAVLKTESTDVDPFKVTPEILTGRK